MPLSMAKTGETVTIRKITGKDEVRIAYVTQPKELTRAIELLGLGIEAYNRKNGR